ncbi:MAG: RES family NAD+ phosphorylase [Bacteroidota bacterium]
MIVYRICQTYPPKHDPLDGYGSFLHGARWNSKGTYAVYTSESLALARSELARHINLESVPENMSVYEIEIPDKDFPEINPLPKTWDQDPISLNAKETGDRFLSDSNNLAFRVPSVCDPNSQNFILNPGSIDYDRVKIKRRYPFKP